MANLLLKIGEATEKRAFEVSHAEYMSGNPALIVREAETGYKRLLTVDSGCKDCIRLKSLRPNPVVASLIAQELIVPSGKSLIGDQLYAINF